MPPARAERVAACPLCGGRRAAPVCRGRDRLYHLSDRAFAYARCGACGVVFQSLRPVEADAAAFYPAHYGPYQTGPVTVRADAGGPLRGPHVPPRAWLHRRAKAAILTILGRLNTALARRLPDPLPGVLATLY